MQDRNWFYLNNGVYPTKIFMFIGKRKEMFATAVAGMRSCFDDPKAMPDAEIFAEKLKTYGTDLMGIDGEFFSVENDVGARVWFVRMDSFTGSVDDTVRLSHECLHAALSILHYCGVSENPPFEALCYLHETIFGKFMIDAFGRVGMLHSSPDENEGEKR